MLYAAKASRPDGRRFRAEESPGSTEKRCRITSGGGDPRESATENKPPPGLAPAARVKRCGKSAPRAWRHERHGKPHREQDRIGAMRGSRTLDPSLDHRPGWLLEAAGDGRPRGMAITRRGVPAAPYRTRLTGRLAADLRQGRCEEGMDSFMPSFFVSAAAALQSAPPRVTRVFPTRGRAWCRRGPSPRSDNCAGPTDPRCRGSAPRAGARTPEHSGRPSHEIRG